MATVEDALQTLREAIQTEIEEEAADADPSFDDEISGIGVNLGFIADEDRDGEEVVAALELYQDMDHDLQVCLSLDEARRLHAALGAIIRKEEATNREVDAAGKLLAGMYE